MANGTQKPQREIKDFQDLDVWKACRRVRVSVFRLVKTFPSEEKHRLVDQLIRASRSPTANLAEGIGRYSLGRERACETIQFCRQAHGSLYELLDHLTVAVDCGYIKQDTYRESHEEIMDAVRLINGFVRYLRNAG